MLDVAELLRLANRGERAAAARLVRTQGLDHAAALHAALSSSAGADGLAGLLAQRRVLRDAEAATLEARQCVRQQRTDQLRKRHAGPASAWQGWFDGSALPNPGRCGIGIRLTGPGATVIELALGGGHGSSSDAEYRALIALLETAVAHGVRDLTVYGDSRVVLDDVSAADGAHAEVLAGYRRRARQLMERIPGLSLRWLPRHRNQAADRLAQQGRSEACALFAHAAPLA
jgi:ribonuclease HI